MTKDDVLIIGFTLVSTSMILNSLEFDIGRKRYLSLGNVGTPNEMLFIIQKDNIGKINDIICISNYDYDGILTCEKLTKIIDIFIKKNEP